MVTLDYVTPLTLRGPHPSGRTDCETTRSKNGLAKIGLAQSGQIRIAKTGLAKVGPFRRVCEAPLRDSFVGLKGLGSHPFVTPFVELKGLRPPPS